jgi:hypothetical protein
VKTAAPEIKALRRPSPPISDGKWVPRRGAETLSNLALTGRGFFPIVTPRKADDGSPRRATEWMHSADPSP